MKKRKLLCLGVMSFVFFDLSNIKKSKNIRIHLNNQSLKFSNKVDEATVFDYVDVLNTYYELAIGDTKQPTKTFEQFYDSYYSESSNRNLYDFTLDLAKENNNYTDVYLVLTNGSSNNISPASSGGNSGGGSTLDDADYILKDSDEYNCTPQEAFAREPFYSIYDYSAIENGDIVWETDTIFFNAGHNALIKNKRRNSAYGYYIETIEAVGGGVQNGFLDDLRMTAYKCKILRVIGRNNNNANSAIYFAEEQLGKKYSLNTFRLNTSIESTEWYCSELVYASWKYAGIDIGVKKEGGKDVYLQLGCLPVDINNSYNTYQLNMPYYGFLSLKVYKKEGSTWKIKIYNTSSINLEVNYNSKMCYFDDAKNWKNLSDVKTIVIYSNSYETVDIKENWFATSIATSYVKGNYRIITYANNLSNDTLVSYENVIKK